MSLFNEMREDGQLHYISQKLAESVEIILNPSSSHDKRLQATKFCEEFKESKTNLLQCGHYLYKSHNNFVVKHFGLQLIHHGIRVNWNNMTHKEKNDLKSLALKHIKTNPVSLLDEPTYLKDAIAKYAVEIMKREWPQNWPDVTNQLGDIAQQGPSQLFTVLRTLLFLAEDVTNADGDLPSERRKDMMSAINVIIEDLFKFFVKTLRNTAETLKSLKMQNDDELNRQILENKLLAETSLNTLCGYVDWVNIIYIVQENALLLQTLCLLLRYNELRLKAAECFEGVVMRKGPSTERVPLLILFSMDALSLIFSSITDIIKSHNDDLNEENHIFLKRVCNILSSLGQLQLANIWGSPNHADIDEPVHFDVYLQALIFLYKHKNMIMSDLISKTYLAFLANKTICKNATFCSYIPQILEISKTKISRGLHPALNSSNLLYPDVDFGSFAEKYTAWTNLRKSTKDIIQDITSLYPSDAFLHAASWLVNLTSTPITTQVSENSVEYCEWDSLASFTSSVVNRLFKNGISFVKEFNECRLKMGDTFISFGDLTKKCIESLLRHNTEALLIQNIVLQMLESFIPFLEIHSELLLKLVYKLFTAVVYKPSDGEDCQSLKSSEYRRSAGSIWIRLCLTHYKLMINIIDDLTKLVESTFIGYNEMTMEKSFMMEGLVAISNGFSHYEKQSAYLKQIMNPVKEQWTSAEIEHALLSPEAFLKYVGLDISNADESRAKERRNKLQICQRFIHVILKRVEIPKDSKEQVKGGFKARLVDEPRNPAISSILPLLSNIFHLIRVLNSLWHPSIRARIPNHLQPALEIHENEKAALFGVDGREGIEKPKEERAKKTLVDSLKTFLFRFNDTLAMTLSDCSRLGEGYFCTPSLGEHIVSYVIEPWKHLPKYRLRNYIRHFLKMYCRVCPPSYYESALVPVIVVTFNQMIERLNKEWEAMRSREHIRTAIDDIDIVTEEDAVNNDEVIESQLVHLLTKNFIETFNSMCTMCRPSLREPYVEKKDESQAKLESADYVLQELPTFLLQHTETCKIVLLLPFIALRWPDVSSFTKAIRLCVPFIRQLIRNPPREVAMVPEMFEQIFTLALQGLQLMGHHVEIQSNLIRNIVIIYDILRPLFPSLKNIMLQVPNIDTISLNKYDVTLMSNEELSEKEKKKIFKALLSGLIGKEVGKMFQYDIRILNLPSLPVVKREKSMNILATENNIGLTKLFEPEST